MMCKSKLRWKYENCQEENVNYKQQVICRKYSQLQGFPGGSVGKNLPANTKDMGSITGPGRSHVLQSS